MEGIKVYIAGPYTKGDVGINVRNAIVMGNKVHTRGFVPFIPHLTHFWHLLSPKSYTDWLEYDNQWLPLCDCVLRLPGESYGADQEVELALSLEMPVYYSLQELCEAYDEAPYVEELQ
jgi:hypothetical protein